MKAELDMNPALKTVFLLSSFTPGTHLAMCRDSLDGLSWKYNCQLVGGVRGAFKHAVVHRTDNWPSATQISQDRGRPIQAVI